MPLTELPEPQQDVVVAGLLRRLWVAPPTSVPFRSLDSMCADWAVEAEQIASRSGGVRDRVLLQDGLALLRALAETAPRSVLLVTDLHAGNVLAAEREPWLVIDPKPHVGDPAFDAVQHLLNCEGRLRADPHGLAQRMGDLLDVEVERLLRWLFARCVQESVNDPRLADVARRIAPG